MNERSRMRVRSARQDTDTADMILRSWNSAGMGYEKPRRDMERLTIFGKAEKGGLRAHKVAQSSQCNDLGAASD